jgi:glycosyltransferase involved in cell wall biosynthesis
MAAKVGNRASTHRPLASGLGSPGERRRRPATSPSVSVITPAISASVLISELLSASTVQGARPLRDVLVADNGSTDGPPGPVDSFRKLRRALSGLEYRTRDANAARSTDAAAARDAGLLFGDADDRVDRLVAALRDRRPRRWASPQ